MSDSKTVLREEAKRHRVRMDTRSEDPEKAADNFFKAIGPATGQVVALYWPKGRELDTLPLLERLLERGFECALPVVQKDSRELLFFTWDGLAPLNTGLMGTLEPPHEDISQHVEPDIIIVPLLAFDRRGYRLGYGGGYFDATLKALRERKELLAAGFAYSQQAVLFNLPVEDHDQPLDWVITPGDVYCYSSKK